METARAKIISPRRYITKGTLLSLQIKTNAIEVFDHIDCASTIAISDSVDVLPNRAVFRHFSQDILSSGDLRTENVG